MSWLISSGTKMSFFKILPEVVRVGKLTIILQHIPTILQAGTTIS
jgi:hypothetical protein